MAEGGRTVNSRRHFLRDSLAGAAGVAASTWLPAVTAAQPSRPGARLDAARARHQVVWEWIKGHAGHPENERADALARAGMARFKPPKPARGEDGAPR